MYEVYGNVLQRSSELVVQLSAPAPPGGVSLYYASGDGTATAGSDYPALAGTLVFAEGERDKRIPLEWMGDDVLEHVETFTVRVSNVVGAIPTTPEVTFDIVDDDARTGGNLRPDGAP